MTDTPAHRRPPALQHPGARTTLGWTRTRSAAPDCSPTKGGALTRLLDAPFVAALDEKQKYADNDLPLLLCVTSSAHVADWISAAARR